MTTPQVEIEGASQYVGDEQVVNSLPPSRMEPQNPAQQIQTALNLKRQVSELNSYEESDVIFREVTPPTRWDTLYSMQTGEPIRVKHHRTELILMRRDTDGKLMFTSYPHEAPTFTPGNFKCFLAPDSPERQSGELQEAGIAFKTCKSSHLGSLYSRNLHAQNKHKGEWKMWDEYQKAKKEALRDTQQATQTEAMLAMVKEISGQSGALPSTPGGE